MLLCARSVDEVLARPSEYDLSGDTDLCKVLVVHGRFGFVGIVEYDSNACFGDSRLPALVDEILKVLRSNCRHVGDSEHEADRVEDVGFPGSIETGD